MSEVMTAKSALDQAELLRRQEDAEKIVTPFHYRKPDDEGMRVALSLCKTDLFRARVVVMKKGFGETNLHYHSNADSFWMVLKGRVRFHGPDERVIGDFGPNEGTSTPRFSRYWFENIGDEDLEMVHLFVTPKAGDHHTGRTDAAPRPERMGAVENATKHLGAAH